MRMFDVFVNDTKYEVAIEEKKEQAGSISVSSAPASKPAAASRPPAPAVASKPSTPTAGRDSGEGTVVAQMPGTIVDIDVNVGDKVTRGQKLLVLEAMKMENEIVAPQDGTISEISVTAGALVNAGDVLVVLI